MQIPGEWHPCDDGVERPAIPAEIMAGDGSWLLAPFLLDTGADQTVFCADTQAALNLPTSTARDRLGGLGGLVQPVTVQVVIRLPQEQGGAVSFRGQFAAVADPEALDMSVPGRDITGLFAVIVDRPGRVVFLVGQRHRYAILGG